MLTLHFEKLQGTVGDGVQVRWSLVPSSVSEMGSHDGRIHHEPFVWVNTDTEKSRVSVDLETVVTSFEIVEDASPVEDGQVGHVLLFEEFWGVALENFVLRKGQRVAIFCRDFDSLVSVASGDLSFDVDNFWIGDPTLGLGVEWRGPLGKKLLHRRLEPNPIGMLWTQFLHLLRHLGFM
jgi:hypothetical protein